MAVPLTGTYALRGGCIRSFASAQFAHVTIVTSGLSVQDCTVVREVLRKPEPVERGMPVVASYCLWPCSWIRCVGVESHVLTAFSGRSGRPTHLGFSAIVEADVRDPPMRREASCRPPSTDGSHRWLWAISSRSFAMRSLLGLWMAIRSLRLGAIRQLLHSWPTRSPVPMWAQSGILLALDKHCLASDRPCLWLSTYVRQDAEARQSVMRDGSW